MNNQPVFVQTPALGLLQLTDSVQSGTVLTANDTPVKITAFQAVSDESVTRTIVVNVLSSNTYFPLYSFTIAANTGLDTSSTPKDIITNLPMAVDNDGQKYLFLSANQSLVVNATAALNTGKAITFAVVYGGF